MIHSMLSICTLFFLMLLSNGFDAMGRQGNPITIEEAIGNYIIGWRDGDPELLKKAFDMEAGVILWVDKEKKQEQLKSMKLSELVSNIRPHEGYGIDYEIQTLEVIDDQLAMAFVKIPREDNHYIDCLELQKINDDWKIVLKSFVYFRKQ